MSAGDRPRAVAVGGGTGLPRVLTSLLTLGYEPTAVVTMADDGGSSGELRRLMGILPPGDVRNCLVALSSDELLGAVFQYRFPRGEGLAGHALGNLLIAALADVTGDFPEAIRAAGVLLEARGTVLPSTLTDVQLVAVDRDGNPIAGQATIAKNPTPIADVQLQPGSPDAYPPVLDAIREADLVVVGPGSLFTSIIPNLLVGGVAEALRECSGRRVYVCNVANQRGETGGMDAAEHVEALRAHGAEDALDVVLVHDNDCGTVGTAECVDGSREVCDRITGYGMEVLVTEMADHRDPRHHDRNLLTEALRRVAS